ncbi:MAG: NAD(P)-dependent alcohol dehydrogenase [Polyangiaceae bacterium]|nr:NAD(P)-dependent alcohol dehydrogenase [Polyangiaceae bacterium]
MRIIEIGERFGLEQLRERTVPDPEPGPGEVRLRMRAASLNHRDLLMIRGRYNPRQPLPLVPLSDGVGVVDRLGTGVDGLCLGDRVCPALLPTWPAGEPDRAALRRGLGGPLPGVACEFVIARPEQVVPIPEHLGDFGAATLPCAALTAWTALVSHGRLRAGDRVLVLGTGGVSVFALQFARLAGARVCVTSSDQQKLERACALGAERGMNYLTEPAWGEAVRLWSEGGVDHVVEVGGAGTLAQSLRAVRVGGTISVIGVLAGTATQLDVLPILMNQVRLQGIFGGSRASFVEMNRAIAASRLVPVVDTVYPFGVEGLKAALGHLESGRHFGKIVLDYGVT